MQGHGWQYTKQSSVPTGGGNAVSVPLPTHPVLQSLTVWVVSQTALTNMTAQPRINGVSYGSPTAIVGAKAADLVFDAADLLIPANETSVDPFVFDVLLTNTGGSTQSVSLYFVGIGRDGG